MRYLRLFLTFLTLIAWAAVAQAQRRQFTVQIESASSQPAAESRVQQLKAQGLEAYWIKSNLAGVGLRYRVRVGKFPTRAAAKMYGERLRQQGAVNDFFVAEYEAPEAVTAEIKKPGPKPPVMEKSPPATPAVETPKPTRVEPTDNASPKPTPAPRQRLSTPPGSSLPPDRVKRPRDAVAVVPVSDEKVLAKNSLSGKSGENKKGDVPAAPQPDNVAIAAAAASEAAIAEFRRFQDTAFGYSFEYPRHWDGGKLSDDELQAQRIDAGVMFRSKQDAAFMNAIWNRLKGANSPSYDNSLIVDLVVKSLGSSSGFEGLSETGRRVVTQGKQVNTFIDLKTIMRQPNAPAALEFLGKAVIIRSNEGILLVVAFYSKNSPPSVAESAARIIGSAQAPE